MRLEFILYRAFLRLCRGTKGVCTGVLRALLSLCKAILGVCGGGILGAFRIHSL